jgi:hypothetical protein
MVINKYYEQKNRIYFSYGLQYPLPVLKHKMDYDHHTYSHAGISSLLFFECDIGLYLLRKTKNVPSPGVSLKALAVFLPFIVLSFSTSEKRADQIMHNGMDQNNSATVRPKAQIIRKKLIYSLYFRFTQLSVITTNTIKTCIVIPVNFANIEHTEQYSSSLSL